MSRLMRKMDQFEVDALYGRLKTFVENQRTPRNPSMKLGEDLESELGLEFLICPLREVGCFYHSVFVDRLRQDFGKNADVYDEPEPGGTVRRFIQVPVMIEDIAKDTRFKRGGRGLARIEEDDTLYRPSREKMMFLCFADIVLGMFLWHRISTGAHGF